MAPRDAPDESDAARSADGGTVFASRAARRRAVGWLLVVAAAVLVAAVALRPYLAWLADPAAVRATVSQFGPWGPAVFVSLQAVQIVLAPIPGQAMGFVAGYLFGVVRGTAYVVAGGALGSFAAFALSRRFGRPFVESVVAADVLDRFDALVASHGEATLFLLFLFPGFPDDALCFVGGLSTVRLRRLVAVSVLGRLPTYLIATMAGADASQARYGDALVWLAVLAVLGVVGYWKRDALLRLVERASA